MSATSAAASGATAAAGVQRWLVGTDIVDLARAEHLLTRYGSGLMDWLRVPPELAAGPWTPLRLARQLAVSEAVIKAVGGRAPGFRWGDAAALDEPPSEGPAAAAMTSPAVLTLLAAFAEGTGAARPRPYAVLVTGSTAARAGRRLGLVAGQAIPAVACSAVKGGELFAVTVLGI